MRKLLVTIVVLMAATISFSGAPPDRLPTLTAPAEAKTVQVTVGQPPPAAACSTQSTASDQSGNTGNLFDIRGSTSSIGQTFTAGAASYSLYSVTVYATPAGANVELTAKLCTEDACAEQVGGTATGTTSGTGALELIFPSDNRPSITNTNSYFICVQNTDTTYNNRVSITYANTGGTSGGDLYANASDGSCDQSVETGKDLYFVLKKCD